MTSGQTPNPVGLRHAHAASMGLPEPQPKPTSLNSQVEAARGVPRIVPPNALDLGRACRRFGWSIAGVWFGGGGSLRAGSKARLGPECMLPVNASEVAAAVMEQ